MRGARAARAAWLTAVALPLVAACGGHGLYVRPGIETCVGCAASEAELDVRVVLIGDTGKLDGESGNLDLLAEVAGAVPQRTTILFLGDNIYPAGLPAADEESADEERRAAESVLRLWLGAVHRSGAAAVFLPGNHDWRKGKSGGRERVLQQARFIADNAGDPGRVRVLPADACPGPVTLDLGRSVRILIADTQWLLADADRRGDGCAVDDGDGAMQQVRDDKGFFAALAAAASAAGSRHVLFAGHHPLRTRGPHGGYFTAREFVFPLTVWKSWLYLPLPILYPVVRYGIVRNPQDLVSGRNKAMVAGLEAALAEAPGPVLTAAGHEHVLEVHQEDDDVHVVSGSGVHADIVGVRDSTLFKHGAHGLMVVDYFGDGRVLLRVVEPRSGAPAIETFGRWLVED